MRDDLILSDEAKQLLSDNGVPLLQRGWDTHELLKVIPQSIRDIDNETYHIEISFNGSGWWVRYKPYLKSNYKPKSSYEDGWISASLLDALVVCLIDLIKDGIACLHLT